MSSWKLRKLPADQSRATFDKIQDWLADSEKRPPILWVHGPVGYGKTTLAQTLSKTYKSSQLACSFFWSKSAPRRPTTNRQLVATIVYQLCQLDGSTLFTERVVDAVERDPSIFNRALARQTEAPMINPLMAHVYPDKSPSNPSDYLLLIFDGLDECEGTDAQKVVLDILLDVAQKISLPLRILLCCRYEFNIRNVLESGSARHLVDSHALEKDFSGYADVQKPILSEFDKIKQDHPSRDNLPLELPKAENVDVLVKRSNRAFIYASVVMKYIGSEDNHPQTRLNEMIRSSAFQGAFAPLDAMYMHLLHEIPLHGKVKVKEVLDWMIIAPPYVQSKDQAESIKTVQFIDTLLGFKPGETRIVLKYLASVIHVPDHLESDLPVRFFHASFSELLKDRFLKQDMFGSQRGWSTTLYLNRKPSCPTAPSSDGAIFPCS